MNIQDLGQDATDADLQVYRNAVARIMDEQGMTETEADIFLWGDGRYRQRLMPEDID